MNEKSKKRKYRQIGIAQCILEGKSTRQAAEEYGISRCTVKRDLEELYWNGYGNDEKEANKYRVLAYKALKVIESRTTRKE